MQLNTEMAASLHGGKGVHSLTYSYQEEKRDLKPLRTKGLLLQMQELRAALFTHAPSKNLLRCTHKEWARGKVTKRAPTHLCVHATPAKCRRDP